jgi:hypothetical protein
MNKTEAEYARLLKVDKDVHRWWYEPFSVRLSHPKTGKPATYTPDFMILMEDGTTYIDDVKGGMVDKAAIVRIKTAAELYPLWIWRLATRLTAKQGGGWDITEV